MSTVTALSPMPSPDPAWSRQVTSPRRSGGAYSASRDAPPGTSPRREALQQSQRDEQDGSEDADRRMAGEQPHGERRAGHEQHDRRQGPLAAHPVAQRAEEEAAERPDGERDREDREAGEQRGRGVAGGEEDAADDDGQIAVDRVVEPFHGVSDGAAEYRLAERRRLHFISVMLIFHLLDHDVIPVLMLLVIRRFR
nr:hypothetical protein [Actinomadura madurae]